MTVSKEKFFQRLSLCWILSFKPSSFQKSYFPIFFRGENCVSPSLPQCLKTLSLEGSWISLQGNNALPHMNFSAHSGVDSRSFGALAWDLFSSGGLYNSKSKAHRNFLVFHFQVKGLVFALGTDNNCDSSFQTMPQKGVFWCSRGRSSEKFFRWQAPRLHPSHPSLLQ